VEGADKYETGTNVTRTSKKTPLTTFMKGEEWRYLTTMYVFCVYPAMSEKSENLSDLDKKDRNKRHSSPFINVVKGVFFEEPKQDNQRA
jgi:lipopolysaccharide assembly outer membrane protein LptD (OstA)